jgi:NADH-quinone oxidoreductase subunit F
VSNADWDPAAIDRIVADIGRAPGDLIPILRAIQDEYHYLPEAALRRVCETTAITPRTLAGVATFYAQFRHRPAGRYRLRVCEGTACHVRGAGDIAEAFRHELRIPPDDDTDPERVFTVEKVACLGCCMLAPVAQLQDVTYGTLAPRGIPEVLRDFLAAQAVETAASGRHRRHRPADKHLAEVRSCLCSSCRAAGADAVVRELHRQIDADRLAVRVREVGCTGISYQAPLLDVIVNGGVFRYGAVQPEHVGYVICNGDEGDPGAFMDRMLLESFPYRIIEGMAIAAWRSAPREGYFYIRAEYPLAVQADPRGDRTLPSAGCSASDVLGQRLRLRRCA